MPRPGLTTLMMQGDTCSSLSSAQPVRSNESFRPVVLVSGKPQQHRPFRPCCSSQWSKVKNIFCVNRRDKECLAKSLCHRRFPPRILSSRQAWCLIFFDNLSLEYLQIVFVGFWPTTHESLTACWYSWKDILMAWKIAVWWVVTAGNVCSLRVPLGYRMHGCNYVQLRIASESTIFAVLTEFELNFFAWENIRSIGFQSKPILFRVGMNPDFGPEIWQLAWNIGKFEWFLLLSWIFLWKKRSIINLASVRICILVFNCAWNMYC